MTQKERTAAETLGYTQTTWDNVSGTEPQLASGNKKWSELIACPDGGILIFVCLFALTCFMLNKVLFVIRALNAIVKFHVSLSSDMHTHLITESTSYAHIDDAKTVKPSGPSPMSK